MDPSVIDPNALSVGASLALLAIVVLVTVPLYGFSMKWSLSLAGCGQHGFGWSFFVWLVSGTCGSIAMAAVTIALGNGSFLASLACWLVVASVVVSVMTQSNPISAFGANIAFMVICSIGCVAFAFVAFFAIMLIGPDNLPDFDPSSFQPTQQNASSEPAEWDTNIVSFPNMPVKENPTTAESVQSVPASLDDAFFEPERPAATQGHSFQQSPSGQPNPSGPSSPWRGVQSNPFVK